MTRTADRTEEHHVVARVARWLSGLEGWRRALAALTAGALSALAFAPFFVWPVLFVTLPGLVLLIDGSAARHPGEMRLRIKDAARTGWFFGFGFFLAGLYWIANSFLVEADKFIWLLPLAVTVLPAGLALFFSAGTALAASLWGPGLVRVFALALAFGITEWLRGHVLTGLPWNTLGYALTANDAMMQWASLFGIYGLTFLAVAIFSAPAALLDPARERGSSRAGFRAVYVVLALCVLSGGWAWGKIRLQNADDGTVPGVNLRIVQPNIPQKEKWVPDKAASIFRRYLELSEKGNGGSGKGLQDITHLIWPESAMPFLLTESTEALTAIARMLPDHTHLLTGQARAQDALRPDGSLIRQHIYNSLLVMNGRAMVLTQYDKQHLVPFGEYLPFQETLESMGLEQLTRVRGGFTPGARKAFETPEGTPPFVPLICYEIIFPEAVAARARAPQWMLNVTNDAWFGNTIGPYQHFHQARVRVVEQGLPLVRAANTGISAVVDGYGRVVASLELGQYGVIDSALPEMTPRTLFSRLGWRIELMMSLLAGLCWIISRLGCRKKMV